jgi:TolA-binding protein
MPAMSSSQPVDRAARARRRLIVTVCALVASAGAALVFHLRTVAAAEPIQVVRLSEETLPAEDMPSLVATPEASPAGDWIEAPDSSDDGAAPVSPAANSAPTNSPAAAETQAAQAQPTPIPTPTDIAPLEVGSIAPQSQISDAPLDDLIQKVSATQPALAASLRMTDQARQEILSHHEDEAIQTLTRAISIDATSPYAYFYLGRAYLGKKNYAQAITFLNRAENRFGANPKWLGETLAFEGLANEQSGQTATAIGCYQKALVSVPGNLMARVGLTRLSGEQMHPAVQPVSGPGPAAGIPDASPSGGSPIPPPPPDSAPPPPAN